LLHAARTQFDLILVDSAPILAVPDNILLANIIDRVILVVKATKTSGRELRKALVALEESGGRILGVVLNEANPRDVPYYHPRYRKYYTPSTAKDSQGASRRPALTPSVEAKKGAGAPATRDDPNKRTPAAGMTADGTTRKDA
jgi:Mrp family chromosome partitioning ATPase